MRIAYFAFSEQANAPHAGSVHINALIKNLERLGSHVSLYARKNGHPCKIPVTHYKLVSFPVGFREHILPKAVSACKTYLQIKAEIKREKFDVVYERWAHPDLYSYLLASKLSLPRILEVNSLFSEEIHNFPGILTVSRVFRNMQFHYCESIITQTETLRRILASVTKKPIYVVPNGVDTAIFKPNLRYDNIDLPRNLNGSHFVTYIGSFKNWHGVHQIPYIAEKVLQEHKVKFLLVGDGPLFQSVCRRVKNSPTLRQNVILAGSFAHKDVPYFLSLSDVLIAPFDDSYYPALKRYGFWWSPVKLFEYMSAGKPIVSYEYEEVANIIRRHNALARIGDVHNFARKIIDLIEDPHLRKKIGKKNRNIAVEEYDWSVRAKQTLDICRKVVLNYEND